MVLEARIRVRHRGCWTESFRGRQHATMLSLDHERCVTVMHGETEEQVDEFVRARAEDAEDAIVVDRAPLSVVLKCRPRPGGVIATIHAHGCSILWPVLNSKGFETYTVVAPSRERLSALLERLGEIGEAKLERIAEVSADALSVHVPLTDLTSGLTAKQLDALRLAVSRGYYDSPRRTSTETLARGVGLSRSTFQEHLRKAERHVLERFAHVLASSPALQRTASRGPGRPARVTPTPEAPRSGRPSGTPARRPRPTSTLPSGDALPPSGASP